MLAQTKIETYFCFRDKYQNPGGYTIFHFKVPKKNGPVVSPPLTALKKTYQTADNKLTLKTEKVLNIRIHILGINSEKFSSGKLKFFI